MSKNEDWVWKPDGIHECSPKLYRLKQRLKNVTVEILEADDGEVSVARQRQGNTEDITDEEE